MSDDKKEPWLNLLALPTVLLAVWAMLATFKDGGHSTGTVLLSSIASLLKQKPVYHLGRAVGAVGVVYFLNGFFLFLPA